MSGGERLREIVGKMTPGPWKWAFWANNAGIPLGGFYIPGLTRPDRIVADKAHGAVEMLADDAEGLVLLRNCADELLAIVEAARYASKRLASAGLIHTPAALQLEKALCALDAKLGKEG